MTLNTQRDVCTEIIDNRIGFNHYFIKSTCHIRNHLEKIIALIIYGNFKFFSQCITPPIEFILLIHGKIMDHDVQILIIRKMSENFFSCSSDFIFRGTIVTKEEISGRIHQTIIDVTIICLKFGYEIFMTNAFQIFDIIHLHEVGNEFFLRLIISSSNKNQCICFELLQRFYVHILCHNMYLQILNV